MNSRIKLLIVLAVVGIVSIVVGLVAVLGFMMRDRSDPTSEPKALPAPPAAQSPTLDRIRARGHLRVATDTGTPPFTGTPPMFFTNAQGEQDGFDMLLARRIAEAAGVKEVKVHHALYADLATELKGKPEEVDLVISGFVPWPEPGLAWSEPYLNFGLCLIVPTRSKVNTVADLWGKRVGVFEDEAAYAEAQRLVKGYTSLERYEEGYYDLMVTGKLDAFIFDFPYTPAELEDFYLKNPHHRGKLRVAQYNLTDSTYNAALREGDPAFLALVNQTIQAFVEGPEYAEAVQKYLKGSETVDLSPSEKPKDGGRIHVVEAGETLSTIARKELGGSDRWRDIWELNKARLGNPNLLEVGDELVIPLAQ
jgi:ABC-type amino acid transport substrate-binding protein